MDYSLRSTLNLYDFFKNIINPEQELLEISVHLIPDSPHSQCSIQVPAETFLAELHMDHLSIHFLTNVTLTTYCIHTITLTATNL